MRTLLEQGEFKGKPTVSIWEVNEEGDKLKQYPILAFGTNKAKIILAHLDEIKAFVGSDEQDKD